MASIYKEIHLNVPATKAWDAVRDVKNVHIRLVPGYADEVQLTGNTRILTMSNGNTVREVILGINENALRLAYTVVETKMPIVFHHASFQVFPKSDCSCALVWITDILPNALEDEVRVRVDSGASVMKQTIERERNWPERRLEEDGANV